VTISGSGFIGATGATVGGVSLTSFSVVSDGTITGVTGAHASPGTVDVVVQGAAGNGTLAGGFTYSFDPASLSLQGWWRGGDYDGSVTWTGTASAGNSGSHNLTVNTGLPTNGGATLNGHTTIHFSGGAFGPSFQNATFANFVSASAWSSWMLINFVDEPSDNADTNPFGNANVWRDDNGDAGVFVRSTGPGVQAAVNDGAVKCASTTFTNGAWHLLQARFNGTNVEVRVDNGSWVTHAAGNMTSNIGQLLVGEGISNAIHGDMAEMSLANTRFSDATFDNVRGYINSRYGLSI
jgi:hypothetical protein